MKTNKLVGLGAVVLSIGAIKIESCLGYLATPLEEGRLPIEERDSKTEIDFLHKYDFYTNPCYKDRTHESMAYDGCNLNSEIDFSIYQSYNSGPHEMIAYDGCTWNLKYWSYERGLTDLGLAEEICKGPIIYPSYVNGNNFGSSYDSVLAEDLYQTALEKVVEMCLIREE